MFRCLLWAIAAAVRPKVLLIADNVCLRQQLLVLQRQKPRPGLKDTDRRFWVLACRSFIDWRTSLLIVKPETVLRWHPHGWRTYWRRRSSRRGKPGRRPIALGMRFLLRPDHHVSDAIRVLRDSSRQPASSPRARDAASNRRVDGAADWRMLRLGRPAATFSRS